MSIKTNTLLAVGAVVVAYSAFWGKKASEVELLYFTQADFFPWFPAMSGELIIRVDAMALLLTDYGYTFQINRIGLESEGSNSQHNVTKWGEVRAIDIGVLLNGKRLTKPELKLFYDRVIALELFSGVGVYPLWNTPGVHLDVREDRTPQSPATWGDVGVGSKHVYVGALQALA